MPFEFTNTTIPEVVIISSKVFHDERGFFREAYKASEFAEAGITERFVQDNHSFSRQGVLRGIHFQRRPFAQGKLVQVITGNVWDVAVDLRPESPSFSRWVGVKLDAESGRMLYIPPGFGHAFIVLSAAAHFLYKTTQEYVKEADRGLRWDDPDIGIDWPTKNVSVSAKDAQLPGIKVLLEQGVL